MEDFGIVLNMGRLFIPNITLLLGLMIGWAFLSLITCSRSDESCLFRNSSSNSKQNWTYGRDYCLVQRDWWQLMVCLTKWYLSCSKQTNNFLILLNNCINHKKIPNGVVSISIRNNFYYFLRYVVYIRLIVICYCVGLSVGMFAISTCDQEMDGGEIIHRNEVLLLWARRNEKKSR